MISWNQVFRNSWHWFAYLYLIFCAKPIALLLHFEAADLPLATLLFPLTNLIPSLIMFAPALFFHAYKNKKDPSFVNTSFFRKHWSYISAVSVSILLLGQISILEDLNKAN